MVFGQIPIQLLKVSWSLLVVGYSDSLDVLEHLLKVNLHPHEEKYKPQKRTQGYIEKEIPLNIYSANDDLNLPISQNSLIMSGKLQGENPNDVRSDLESNILPSSSFYWHYKLYIIYTIHTTQERKVPF